MKRTDIYQIRFIARCESGLHIGGSDDELAIGGSDKPVIKNPETRKPYIPGSSLKGKMRAELEVELEEFGCRKGEEDKPCGCAEEDCPICRVFGAHNPRSTLGPSRIIVRDGQPLEGWRIENKMENRVDRKTGAAKDPRSNERVVEGTEFSMQIVLQVFHKDKDFKYKGLTGGKALQAVVADGLNLVQKTGLGGGTSRGSGAISFSEFELDGEKWELWSE